MVNNYEGLFIIEAKLSEEKRNALIEKFSKMAGSSVKVDKWGVKKYAYPINYQNEGFYVLMTFSGDNTVVEKIVKLMNITDGIVRHMFIKIENNKKPVKKSTKKESVKEVADPEVIKAEKPVAKPTAKLEEKPAAKPAAKAVAEKSAANKPAATKTEVAKKTK